MFHPKIILCYSQWCCKDLPIIYYQLIWLSEHSLVIYLITTRFLSRHYVMMIFYIYFQTNHMLPGGNHEGHAITGDSGLLRLPVNLALHAASTLAGLMNNLYRILLYSYQTMHFAGNMYYRLPIKPIKYTANLKESDRKMRTPDNQ